MKERYKWFFGEIKNSWIRFKWGYIVCAIIFCTVIIAALAMH